MNWYLKVLKQYADFNGRARRTEYWMFVLIYLVTLIIAAVLDNLLGLTFMEGIPYGYLYLAVALFSLIPSISVGVRRLHDIGKSGWMYLIVLIPFVGGIWLLVLFVTEGNKGDNQYGPDPKA
ncbi:MAG: DUF805 domain-containing protein [Flavobacteriaceae bacterium]|nr:DUF805 domain-containing protein [Flavobacteriaceae bacterium]